MFKQKENEKLQSRREFFKNAAKAALPVVGAVVLANLPIVQAEASSCQGSCYMACDGGCRKSCMGSCKGTCNSTCKGGCYYTSR